MVDLIGKSDGTLLNKHLQDVESCVLSICQAFELNDYEQLKLAGKTHDSGKAGVFFQNRMNGIRNHDWYRHELFSFVIMHALCNNSKDHYFTLAAILSHHKNLDDDNLICWMNPIDNLTDLANELEDLFNEQIIPKWSSLLKVLPGLQLPMGYQSCVEVMIEISFMARNNTIWDKIGREFVNSRGVLIAADHLVSSGVKNSIILGKNITISSLDDYMNQHVERWNGWCKHQNDCQIDGNVMLIAPTGSGKTEAAILWALHNRKKYERIFYVLPYRISINAIAQRLVEVFPDHIPPIKISKSNIVSILHGNSDLAYMQDIFEDENRIVSKKEADEWARIRTQTAHKIYSPIKAATIYQIIEIFLGRKFFEVGLFELTNSLVIIDEIQAYDGHTQGLILVLLECLHKLDVPVFIMTATLPEKMRKYLSVALGGCTNITLDNNDPLLTQVRHSIIIHDDIIENYIDSIRKSVESGRHTVVVCNTVNKAIHMYEKLKRFQPLLIHSRFTLHDRAKRETKNNIESHKLVISTQVIEVSLDVSFDILFTELAPADSLIQRFGRVNRYNLLEDPAQCHIFIGDDKGSQQIYDSTILDATRNSIPLGELDFNTCCKWVSDVYPNGLSEREQQASNDAYQIFRSIVNQLHPMLSVDVNIDLERTLSKSTTVIPASKANEWKRLRERKQYTKAKSLTIQLATQSLDAVAYKVPNAKSYLVKDENERRYMHAESISKYRNDYIIIVHFEYWKSLGLRLDKPIKRKNYFNILD